VKLVGHFDRYISVHRNLTFFPEDRGSNFLRNVDNFVPRYTISSRTFAAAITLPTFIREVLGSNLTKC
jgi:hypothetical protein